MQKRKPLISFSLSFSLSVLRWLSIHSLLHSLSSLPPVSGFASLYYFAHSSFYESDITIIARSIRPRFRRTKITLHLSLPLLNGIASLLLLILSLLLSQVSLRSIISPIHRSMNLILDRSLRDRLGRCSRELKLLSIPLSLSLYVSLLS